MPELYGCSLKGYQKMKKPPLVIESLEVRPLTLEHWDDFVQLFGPNGACAGCWCMWYRMMDKEFKKTGKQGHLDGMRTLVHNGQEPGLILYANGTPAGWVTVAPRDQYIRLSTSKILAPVDDQEVWSIPCFFIHRNFRRAGLMEKLIRAAVEYARENGARIVEAYPVETLEKMSYLSVYTGLASTFSRCGFTEVARRSEKRPIMRMELNG